MRAWIRNSFLSSYILYSALEAYFYLSTETMSNIIIRSPPPFYIKLFYTKTLPSHTYLDHKICPTPSNFRSSSSGSQRLVLLRHSERFFTRPPRALSLHQHQARILVTPRPHLLCHPAQISSASKLKASSGPSTVLHSSHPPPPSSISSCSDQRRLPASSEPSTVLHSRSPSVPKSRAGNSSRAPSALASHASQTRQTSHRSRAQAVPKKRGFRDEVGGDYKDLAVALKPGR